MKTFENTATHEHTIACQGVDCVAYGSAASDWFGDLEISEDAEVGNRDIYGDRG